MNQLISLREVRLHNGVWDFTIQQPSNDLIIQAVIKVHTFKKLKMCAVDWDSTKIATSLILCACVSTE